MSKTKIYRIKMLFMLLLMSLYSVAFSQGWGNGEASGYLSSVRGEVQLFTDRDVYIDGEPVWFSAIVFTNEKINKSPLSRVLYLELFNPQGEVQVHGKFPVRSGRANGKLAIPEDIPSGNYILRAYTMYMRNFPVRQFFMKAIAVVNPEIPPYHAGGEVIRIVPESGAFISGAENRIFLDVGSYLAQNADTIQLVNLSDSSATIIDPMPNGLAEAVLKPSDSSKYQLQIILKDGRKVTKDFPETDSHSIMIRVIRQETNLAVYLDAGDKDLSGSRLMVFDQGFEMTGKQALPDGSAEKPVLIPLKELHAGINYLVLVDEGEEILNVSAYYLLPENAFHRINLDYPSRIKQSGQVQLSLDTGENHQCELSVAAVVRGSSWADREFVPEFIIKNPLLLEGFYQNHVQPDQAFKKQNRIIMGLLHERLNTAQFHARFEKQTKTELEYLPEIRDVSISGMLRDKETAMPLGGKRLYLSVLFDNPQVHLYDTRSDGRFIFSLNNLSGMQDVFITTDVNDSLENVELLINNDFSADFPQFIETAFSLGPDDKEMIEALIRNKEIRMAFDTARHQSQSRKNESSVFFGLDKTVVRLRDFISLKSMEEVFTEIVRPVKVRKNKKDYRLVVTGDNSQFLPGDPLILVDNVPVSDVNKIMEIHPSKVEKIEVVNEVYVLGNNALNGIIMITTKTENFGGIALPDESVFLEYFTLSHKADFKTRAANAENDHLPDFRNTAWWNPSLRLSEGFTSVDFIAPENPDEFEVIVRGFLGNGDKLSGFGLIRVEK